MHFDEARWFWSISGRITKVANFANSTQANEKGFCRHHENI